MSNPTPPHPPSASAPSLPQPPMPLEYLFDHAGATVTELATACQISESEALSMVTILVRDGVVAQHGAGYYPRPALAL